MIIELRGLQFVNKGAELMLYAILQQLRGAEFDYQLVMRHNKNCPKTKVENIGAKRKVNLHKGELNLNYLTYYMPKFIRRIIMHKTDIVFEADVDVVLDGSGFSYGDQWSSIPLHHVCNEIIKFDKVGKKYIFLPQALGPFSRNKDRNLLQKALPKASLICAREEKSFEHIKELNPTINNTFQYPDFTNLVVGEVPTDMNLSKNFFCLIPNNKMISKQNSDKTWDSVYVDIFVALAKLAHKDGMDVVVLNHEGDGDRKICHSIIEKLNFDVKLIEEDSPVVVKGIIGKAQAILCSRFHGCVSALSQSIPCIGTSWSFKYEKLFSEYEQSPYLLNANISEKELQAVFEKAIGRASNSSEKVVDLFKNQSREMWKRVFDVINTR